MKCYVALITNRSDIYDRDWMRSTPDETLEAFTERVHKCYNYSSYYISIYEANKL